MFYEKKTNSRSKAPLLITTITDSCFILPYTSQDVEFICCIEELYAYYYCFIETYMLKTKLTVLICSNV
jgi:hypothetical protein